MRPLASQSLLRFAVRVKTDASRTAVHRRELRERERATTAERESSILFSYTLCEQTVVTLGMVCGTAAIAHTV